MRIVLVAGVALLTGLALADETPPSPRQRTDAKKLHWAFQPLRRPDVPATANRTWARNSIDQFILARLEKSKLAPSPEAERGTLIRRLKFDLLGLPPTPEETDAFIADRDPLAYEKLVERYLASPDFGERWARHWLDAVRFAESDGFETNQPRPNAWPYRDYVIRVFNEDKPYDRFILEQLAGDQFGVPEATGFLVGGPQDKVKSPDINLTLMQRSDELHDMVNTTAATFLGLTVGCARCHNHKFDPISQLDYYGMRAVFAGVQHGERPLERSADPAVTKQMEDLRRQLADLDREIASSEPLAQPTGPSGRRSPVSPLRNVDRFAPTRAKYIRFTILATNNLEPCVDELEVFSTGAAKNIALSSLGVKTTSSGDYPGAAIHKLEHINDGRYGNGRSWISNMTGAGWVQLELPKVETIERIEWARDREGKFADRLATRYRIEVGIEPGKLQTIASSDDRIPFGSKSDNSRIAKLLARRAEIAKQLTEADRQTRAYVGNFTTPEPTYRLHRGDPMQKREPVAPASLSEFSGRLTFTNSPPDLKESGARFPSPLRGRGVGGEGANLAPPSEPMTSSDLQRRLALAHWIASSENPLAARVLVNRLWHHHFGQGIVDTPSDFGLNGGKPSHPELLDWLAKELIDGGWRMKRIHRLIVLSSTYRQSSAGNAAGLGADAGSCLLWRYPPRRLEAEPLRDAYLAVSGKLDLHMGGPGFDLFEPNTNYVKVYNPKQKFGPSEWRRMIYQSKWRMQLDDVFGQFDCPDAGQIAPKRNCSTTPLQALNLLNSRFMLEQARFFAERVAQEASERSQAQVRRAFRLAFQRDPSADELAACDALVRDHGLVALCRALFNANEFVFVD